MPAIMCTRKFEEALARAGHPWGAKGRPRTPGPGRLGDWAATLVSENRELVVALEERTRLSLVVPFLPTEDVPRRFAGALRAALRRLGVRSELVEIECVQIEVAGIMRIRNRQLSDDLEFAEFETACHGDSQDRESIEDMLNAYPYSATDPEGAAAAVRTIFGVGRTGPECDRGAGAPG